MLSEMTSHELAEWQARESLQDEITNVQRRGELTPAQAYDVVRRKYRA
jgi:hypothetical protein